MVTKKATAKRSVTKGAADVTTVYVVSERKFLTWNPIKFSTSFEEANAYRKNMETTSIYGVRGYKISALSAIKTVAL